MNSEKKYKKALEKAEGIIKYYKECNYDAVSIEDLESIFPEIKQSENERIKSLIKGCVYASDITPEGRKEIFAWLEKQGEQKSIDYNEELKKCRENPLYFIDKYVKFEKKQSTWSEEDVKKEFDIYL